MDRESLGRHRKALRVFAGLTQQQLSKAVGVSRATVMKAERGESVALDTVRSLARAVGVDLATYAGDLAPVSAGRD